ncbi:Outer membrane protein beta-barrel domain-containing protein [Pustulibacterium marinum]|uniref:Outer membrane protein beta-barrel domain-containing protein n=1 Tax=Pustulibacterium marinum TaxID=1224947 RepID=A0A1I7H9L6_9FLAO|nr:porin family protein [Pustulibacterium marinum]SFU57383.1 Outer membrane protein beta-barrel domain-containing protein [Pustulibacterium marinum]
MKKLFLLVLICSTAVHAQDGFDVGILGGGNYAYYEYVGDEDVFAEYDAGLGYYLGVFVSVPIAPKVTFAPELLYARQTVKANGNTSDLIGGMFSMDVEADGKEDLLLLPLMFRLNLMKFDFAVGPQVGYSLARNITASAEGISIELDDESMEELFNYSDDPEDRISVNLNFDVGFYLTNRLKIGARYSYGLLLRDEVRTSVWQLGLSYGIL